MPCYSPDDNNCGQHETTIEALRDKIDQLTDQLCNAMKHIKCGTPLSPLNENWWISHEIFDRERGEE